ncbi:hypothetical protein [Streptomyces sp. NPDC096339]|uniref:hypothetical protein n=1 Tax=Streptomyces sp. NPDC096339 TaxID=3366086 RepID=UPI00382797D3
MTSTGSNPFDRMPSDTGWHALTDSATKRELLSQDLYFRECWADVTDAFGPDAHDALAPLALLSFKCDGIAGRRAGATLDFLAGNGFTVLATAGIRHNRHSMRELWRYNWHVYTTDRLELMTLMHGAGDSLMLIVRDDRYDGIIPAAVRLADLKGSADPAKRGPEHLRTVLAPPNQIINFVHVADEPADIVRETGIFLDRPGRLRLLEDVVTALKNDGHGGRAAAEERLASLEAACPASDFDLDAAFDRLGNAKLASPAALSTLRTAAAGGTPLTWDELTALVAPQTGGWDFVRVATAVLSADRPGGPDLLPPSSADAWRARA